jgi:hypothetical protein
MCLTGIPGSRHSQWLKCKSLSHSLPHYGSLNTVEVVSEPLLSQTTVSQTPSLLSQHKILQTKANSGLFLPHRSSPCKWPLHYKIHYLWMVRRKWRGLQLENAGALGKNQPADSHKSKSIGLVTAWDIWCFHHISPTSHFLSNNWRELNKCTLWEEGEKIGT